MMEGQTLHFLSYSKLNSEHNWEGLMYTIKGLNKERALLITITILREVRFSI